jgi:O-methyltransferase involved in polyketide biosynthesis
MRKIEAEIKASIARAGKPWQFGIERGALHQFLTKYGLKAIHEKDVQELEKTFFSDTSGVFGRVDSAHCLVTTETNLE